MNPIIAICISLCFSALFSGLEIAFFAANKLQIEIDSKKGILSARIISLFLKKPSLYITTMLIGNNIALVIYGIMTGRILGPIIETFVSSGALIILIQTLISTIVIIFTAEFLPKAIFRAFANGALQTFSIPTIIIFIILFPATYITNHITKFFLLFTKMNSQELHDPKGFSKVDLEHFVTDSQEENNEVNEDENNFKIFQNALDFSSIRLRECIVPRTELISIEVNESIKKLTLKFVESGYSKIVVFKENIDNIIGYVHTSDMFEQPQCIKDITREIPYVPETKNAKKLLAQFIQQQQSIAVVVDEFGGTAGIVTIEDIIEEIFGEIEDEHDTNELEERQINETEFIFSGRQEIDHLNENYNLGIQTSEEYETLAGYLLHNNESFPSLNSTISIHKLNLTVLKITGTRIELIHLKILEDTE